MFRVLVLLSAAALAASAEAARAETARPQAPRTQTLRAPPFDRLATLRLAEHDFLRPDSRVFLNREGGETIEASLEVGRWRYRLALQRPEGPEFLLVIETRDGARCAGVQTLIVGTRTGRIFHGVCEASVALNHHAHRAYYEAELDRLLGVFHPLLARYGARREES
jgi:hypothetical protein